MKAPTLEWSVDQAEIHYIFDDYLNFNMWI